jgi:hypothetical protein
MLRLQNYAANVTFGPHKLNHFKEKALQGALEALNSRKGKKDPEKEVLKSKIERLKEIIPTQASEIDLLKKRRAQIIRLD